MLTFLRTRPLLVLFAIAFTGWVIGFTVPTAWAGGDQHRTQNPVIDQDEPDEAPTEEDQE